MPANKKSTSTKNCGANVPAHPGLPSPWTRTIVVAPPEPEPFSRLPLKLLLKKYHLTNSSVLSLSVSEHRAWVLNPCWRPSPQRVFSVMFANQTARTADVARSDGPKRPVGFAACSYLWLTCRLGKPSGTGARTEVKRGTYSVYQAALTPGFREQAPNQLWLCPQESPQCQWQWWSHLLQPSALRDPPPPGSATTSA